MIHSPDIERLIRRLRDAQAFATLIGTAPAFLRAIEHCPAIAASDAAVLITGETGTGKELVARALHYTSRRAAFPFVAVNCGALTESLLEDELFGHARGAFTGAHASRAGLLVEGERGTLFLDEVDTLSPRGQVVLLRVLQDKSFRPVGANHEQRADVRIVAATNSALGHMVAAGRFRGDLFYRLGVFSVHLPPLRERRPDIPLLAEHFVRKHTPSGRGAPALSTDALDALATHPWPGNVRELENVILRGVHINQGRSELTAGDLGLEAPSLGADRGKNGAHPQGRSYQTLKREAIETFEREYLTRLMVEHRGNVSRAARSAGKERSDLGKLLRKYHIDPAPFRQHSA